MGLLLRRLIRHFDGHERCQGAWPVKRAVGAWVLATAVIPWAIWAQTPASVSTEKPQKPAELEGLPGLVDFLKNSPPAPEVLQKWWQRQNFETPWMDRPAPALDRAAGLVDAKRPLDVLTAWKVALQNDANVRASKAATAVSAERVVQAKSQQSPTLQFSAGNTRNVLEMSPFKVPDHYPSTNQTLTLRQPVLRLGSEPLVRQAEFQSREADAGFARERQNLCVRVVTAFLEALLAEEQIDFIKSQQEFLNQQLQASKAALQAGYGTRTDIDEAQSRMDLNLAQEVEAMQQRDFARRQMEVLLRQPYGNLAGLRADRLLALQVQPSGLDDWQDLARRSSPELQGLEAQRLAAREEIAKQQAAHLPSMDLVGQMQRSSSENVLNPKSRYNNSTLSLQLNIPLYSGGYQSSAVRQAGAEWERISEVLDAARLDLSLRVHKEYRGFTEGMVRAKALETALRSATLALDSARKSQVAGVRTMVDVLNAEQRLIQARRDLAQARYTALAAMARLYALAGRADEGFVQQLNALMVE